MKFQKELAKKKIALFVFCGSRKSLNKEKEKNKAIQNTKRKYLS